MFWIPKIAFPLLIASLAHLQANLGNSVLNLSPFGSFPFFDVDPKSASVMMNDRSGFSFFDLSA